MSTRSHPRAYEYSVPFKIRSVVSGSELSRNRAPVIAALRLPYPIFSRRTAYQLMRANRLPVSPRHLIVRFRLRGAEVLRYRVLNPGQQHHSMAGTTIPSVGTVAHQASPHESTMGVGWVMSPRPALQRGDRASGSSIRVRPSQHWGKPSRRYIRTTL